jgi:hypothetical protein
MARISKLTGGRPGHAALIGALVGGLFVTAPAWAAPSVRRVVVVTPTTAAPRAAAATPATPPRPRPRVLLMGDSVMDQQGHAAAFVLQQAGVDARTDGEWGSSILSRDQYDHGRTNLTGQWLAEARKQITTFDPRVVAVYLNHNYWPPYPRDASGRLIGDLWSAAGQAMIHQQVTTLIGILRSRGAQVYFVTPIPAGRPSQSADPNVWNVIWHGYLPVLAALHVPVIDSGRAVAAADGHRAETKPDCTGAPTLVRPPGGLHLTRYGAALTGTADAQAIAGVLRTSLHDDAAPGDRTVALVPSPGGGYWLVGCEGSVFHVGAAAALPGARTRVVGHGGVVGAVATATGRGLWLVTADGTIVNIGDAHALRFSPRPASPLVAVATDAAHTGILAVGASGRVSAAGHVRRHTGAVAHTPVVGIAATRDGRGYWLATRDGHVVAFGDARAYGSLPVPATVTAITATPDGRGYWLAGSDGGVFAFGDAQYLGNGRWVTPPYPISVFTPPPGPTIAIVTAPGAHQGYWTLNDTGRVTNHGAAAGHTGDNNMALSTQ